MFTRYMLDTNIVSLAIKRDARILARLTLLAPTSIVISSLTEGELYYGLEKCGSPAGLKNRIQSFLSRVSILPWDSKTAACYGELRAYWESKGVSLGSLDMLIAAHALDAQAILVTADKAFFYISQGLTLENWMK